MLDALKQESPQTTFLFPFKRFWVLLSCLAITLILASYFFTDFILEYAEENEKQHLYQKALLAIEVLDPEEIKGFRAHSWDKNSTFFQQIQTDLAQLRENIPSLDLLYLLGLEGDNFVVLVSAMADSPNIHHHLDIYYPQANKEMLDLLSQRGMDSKTFLQERHEKYISAYVPINEEEAPTSLLLGLCFLTKEWDRRIAVYKWFCYAIISLLFLLFTVFSTAFLRSSRINRLLYSEIIHKNIIAEKLRETETMFRALFEFSSEPLTTVENGFFTSCNKAALKLFCCKNKDEFFKHRPADLSPPIQPDGRRSEMAASHHINRALETGEDFFEWMHKDFHDNEFPAEVSLSCIRLGERTILQARVIDISERKRIEETAKRYEKELEEQVKQRTLDLDIAKKKAEAGNRAKSNFLANVGHELKTPMNGIAGNLYLLQKKTKDPEGARFAEQAIKNATQLTSVINSILDYSKLDQGNMQLNPQPFSLDNVLEPLLEKFDNKCKKKGLLLEISRNNLPPYLNGDSKILLTILENILDNGVKYTQQGRILLELSATELSQTRVELEIRIEDSGIGMDKKQLDNLFQSFSQGDNSSTREYEGLGLGLVHAKKLTDMLKGRLEVESEREKGTIFTIYLPFDIAKTLTDSKQSLGIEHEHTSGYSAPGASEIFLEPSELAEKLDHILHLMESNDMEAVDTFLSMVQSLSTIDPHHTQEAEKMLDQLNFNRARLHLQKLREKIIG